MGEIFRCVLMPFQFCSGHRSKSQSWLGYYVFKLLRILPKNIVSPLLSLCFVSTFRIKKTHLRYNGDKIVYLVKHKFYLEKTAEIKLS